MFTKNIRKDLQNLWLFQVFLSLFSFMNNVMYKLDFIKYLNFCSVKDLLKYDNTNYRVGETICKLYILWHICHRIY